MTVYEKDLELKSEVRHQNDENQKQGFGDLGIQRNKDATIEMTVHLGITDEGV